MLKQYQACKRHWAQPRKIMVSGATIHDATFNCPFWSGWPSRILLWKNKLPQILTSPSFPLPLTHDHVRVQIGPQKLWPEEIGKLTVRQGLRAEIRTCKHKRGVRRDTSIGHQGQVCIIVGAKITQGKYSQKILPKTQIFVGNLSFLALPALPCSTFSFCNEQYGCCKN